MMKRREVPFPKVGWLFVVFIFACGTVHLFEAIIFWHPVYRLSAVVKVVTATVSLTTVAALIPLLPGALRLPLLAEVNRRLQGELAERKRVEAALRLRDRAIAAATNGILIAEARAENHPVIYVNEGFTRLTGYRPDEVMGNAYSFLDGPETDADAVDKIRSALREGGEARLTLLNYRKDGTTFWNELHVSPVHDASGAVTHHVVVQSDVTQQVETAVRIRRLNSQLEETVKRRTMKLEETVRDLEEFSYSVSHDLKAPLRHISAFSGLLKRRCGEQLDDRGREHLQSLAEAAVRAAEMIDRLLAFSQTGRQTMEWEDVDVQRLAEDVRDEFAVACDSRVVKWRIEGLPQVRADRSLLRRVLENLLGNALKFTRPRDCSEIEITARRERDEFVFCVRDNGVGFDMQYADKLFGVFERLHRDEEFEGTGIGLANVRRIIRKHDGRTWAESEPNGGAAFHFTLPGSRCEPHNARRA